MPNIVGLCGSLRAASYNRMLMRLAESVMPASMKLQALEWRDVPVFDGDLLAKGMPPVVAGLREQVRKADGILIVTPEYNFSIPGGLKNVIDWLSRGEDQPFAGKPVAILTASAGPVGGARVQYDLRKVLVFMNSFTVNKPEVFISFAQNKFNAQGELTDEATTKFVGDLLVSLQNLKKRVG
jgi:chromate reductase, NAD(P)H dehydrogenase (quinone)